MDILELIFKPFSWVFRLFVLLLEQGIITRPWYWIGWLLLRVLTIGKYPLYGPNDEDLEGIRVSVITYVLGCITPIAIFIFIM